MISLPEVKWQDAMKTVTTITEESDSLVPVPIQADG
jgi:hypothetical protein